MPSHKTLRHRGNNTVELPFLMSCVLYVLDLRYWVIGVRYPWFGTRFDLVIRTSGKAPRLVLVEAKYRSGGRPVRSYEIERFHQELVKVAKRGASSRCHGLFMTNTRLSPSATERARRYGIGVITNVPLLFKLLKSNGNGNGKPKNGNQGFPPSISPS